MRQKDLQKGKLQSYVTKLFLNLLAYVYVSKCKEHVSKHENLTKSRGVPQLSNIIFSKNFMQLTL